jgi:hypothetical protein
VNELVGVDGESVFYTGKIRKRDTDD